MLRSQFHSSHAVTGFCASLSFHHCSFVHYPVTFLAILTLSSYFHLFVLQDCPGPHRGSNMDMEMLAWRPNLAMCHTRGSDMDMEMLAWRPIWPDFGQILDSYWSKSSHLDSHWSAVVISAMIDHDGCVRDLLLSRVLSILKQPAQPDLYKGSGVLHNVVYITCLN